MSYENRLCHANGSSSESQIQVPWGIQARDTIYDLGNRICLAECIQM